MRSSRFVHAPGIVDRILDVEIQSINQSKERVFSVCNDGNIVPIKTSSDDDFKPFVDEIDVYRSCNGKESILVHTHGPNLSLPSNHDHDTHAKFFKKIPMLEAGCIAGVDGIKCFDNKGKEETILFDGERERRLLDATGTVKFTGKSIWCDRVMARKQEKFFCTVQDDINERPAGIFDQVSFAGGVTWTGEKEADVALLSPFKDGGITCYGSTRGKNRDLSCIVTREGGDK